VVDPHDSDPAFAAALSDCCERVRGGEPLDACIENYPLAYRAELRRLVPIGRRFSAIVEDPTPEFQAALERGLHQALIAEPAPKRRYGLARVGEMWRGGRAVRFAAIAAAALVVLVAGGYGVVTAADASLPDSPLYGVKQAQESAEVWLARDDLARLSLYARLMRRRAVELALAVRAKKGPGVVAPLASRLASTTDAIVDQAIALENEGSPRPALRTEAVIREMERRLDIVLQDSPPEIRPSLEQLRDHLETQRARLPGERPRVPLRGPIRGA